MQDNSGSSEGHSDAQIWETRGETLETVVRIPETSRYNSGNGSTQFRKRQRCGFSVEGRVCSIPDSCKTQGLGSLNVEVGGPKTLIFRVS